MDKNKIVARAFQIACEFLRNHPPYDTCEFDDLAIFACVIDGASDPNGTRWMEYFISKALMEEKNI